jgi:tRNA pseudouridine(38-40) synthase
MPERHTYRIDLAYAGGGFAGFRAQPDRRTVESTLLEALQPLSPGLPAVSAGALTDAGVSAENQVVSFFSRAPITTTDIAEAVKICAPGEIELLAVARVPRAFHAAFSATGRRYRYRLRLPHDLDEPSLARIEPMLRALVGRRCFAAFSRRPRPDVDTVLHLREATLHRRGDTLDIELAADRFLRRMVRVLIATALREAAASSPPDTLVRLCDQADREATAPPADPSRLTLVSVTYP